MLLIINIIFEYGEISEILKMGLLSPVYKTKGTKQQASNYRGITVLPVISKIIETIIKNRSLSSAHAVLLTLMLPILKPNPDVSSLSKSGLI
jgi:hypothetical protein